MDKLKHDTLNIGDRFKISFTPKTMNDDILEEWQMQPTFRNAIWTEDCLIDKHKTKGHNYIKYFDLMRDDIRTASTEYGRAFITLNGKSYILNKHDNLNESENDNDVSNN